MDGCACVCVLGECVSGCEKGRDARVCVPLVSLAADGGDGAPVELVQGRVLAHVVVVFGERLDACLRHALETVLLREDGRRDLVPLGG